jgi:hypothetical protein
LYASKEHDVTSEIKEALECPTLSNEERDLLEGEIHLHQLHHCLKNLKNDKSPGSDGYTADFF